MPGKDPGPSVKDNGAVRGPARPGREQGEGGADRQHRPPRGRQARRPVRLLRGLEQGRPRAARRRDRHRGPLGHDQGRADRRLAQPLSRRARTAPRLASSGAMDPLIVLFGLGVGILVGLTGIGGGSLMTPLLLLVGGYSPVVAIGTDLAYGAVTKTVGGWRHLRAGHVDLRLSWWLAAGSVPGSIIGVVALSRLHDTYGEDFDPYLLGFVAAALMRGRRGDAVPLDVPPRHAPARAQVGRPQAAPQQGRDGGDRAGPRHRARHDLGRLGRARRARADPALPPQAAPCRRHRRLPRRRDAVERRPHAPGLRQRRPRADGDDPRRLDPGRVDRHGAAALRAGQPACATRSRSCSPPPRSACSRRPACRSRRSRWSGSRSRSPSSR